MKVLLAAVAAAGVGSVLMAVVNPASAEAARPNVIMIMTDDQTVSTLSVMPNVRRLLGGHGTTFDNMTTSYPLCCPSRATYLTGQYAHNHKVLDNKAPYGGYPKLRGRNTLPVWLSNAGYDTAHVGKYLNMYGSENPREVPPGWREWHGLVGSSTYQMWGYKINHNGNVRSYGTWDSADPKLYQTDVLRRLAVDYIGRKAPSDKPYFLSVAPLAPHVEVGDKIRDKYGHATPRPAPRHKGKFADRALPRPASFNEPNVDDKPRHIRGLKSLDATAIRNTTVRWRAQLESLLAVDEMVGAIVNKVAAQGELANTTIMFTADNGYLSGEHRIKEGKIHPYEPSIRVPMVIRGAGFPKGRTIRQSVSNVDWAPTILDIAGVKPGLTMDGRSMRAVVKDPASGDRRQLLLETGPKGDQRWYSAVRGSRYTFIKHSTGEVELYDRKSDPQQLHSKHADPAYKDARERLAKRLQQLRGCAGRACWGLPAGAQTGPDSEVEPPPAGESPDDPAASPGGGTGDGSGSPAADGAGGAEATASPGPKSATRLPVTGLALGGLLLLGGGATAAGFALRAVRRRRVTR
ncbi:MAG: sulfatase family protein [Micromonosporaceae bacterium]